MTSLRKTLAGISDHLEESMGVRAALSAPPLAPQARAKDAGRMPMRGFGRIAIDQVIADPDQPRVEFAEDALERLAGSIRDKGQLTTIRVRWSADLGKWVIIFGERRWRAAQRAGLADIDCYFHETDLTDGEILEQQLVENCLREDLLPIEEAKGFARLMRMKGWSGKQLSKALCVSESRVSRTLALLRLPEGIQEKVDEGKISRRAGWEISRLNNHTVQGRLLQESLTGAQTARQVRQRRGKSRPTARGVRQSFVSEGGWKVLVAGPGRSTYHHIEQALALALEEVRHRIACGRQL